MKLSERLFWFARHGHNDVSAVFQLHKLPQSALCDMNRVESTSGIDCALIGAKIISLGIRTAVKRPHEVGRKVVLVRMSLSCANQNNFLRNFMVSPNRSPTA